MQSNGRREEENKRKRKKGWGADKEKRQIEGKVKREKKGANIGWDGIDLSLLKAERKAVSFRWEEGIENESTFTCSSNWPPSTTLQQQQHS